jgi:hypothetical protein
MWNIDPAALASQGIQFGLGAAPQINAQNMQQLQGLLNTALPGYQNIVNQMGTNTQQLLSGQVPTDVQQQIQRSAAFTSLMSGAGGGAGTGATGAITARDLGLTSLQLQQQGQTQGTNLLNLARTTLSPQPVNPLSLLPLSDLINANEWSKSAYFQANEAAFNARSAAAAAQVGAPATGPLGGISSSLQSLFGQLGQKNPNTGQTGFQSLLGLFGGGGGGGGSDVPDFQTSLTAMG